jgi:hypothetical protein
VITDLCVACDGVRSSAIVDAIPPACRRSIDVAGVTIDGEIGVVESPAWMLRRGARSLVPSFSLLGGPPCSVRFEASGLVAGQWTPWVATATVGPEAFLPDLPGRDLAVDIDAYSAARPVDGARLRVRVRPARALARPWMMALSASDLAPLEPTEEGEGASRLRVPPRSQMEEAAPIRDRICSPTCVAMVLAFWGRGGEVAALAREIYHPGLDRYGVWPAAIHAAARRGVAGYLLRFPDWASASWCLARGLPVIASIRFEPGELEGAPMARTDGHLVVLTGEAGHHVLVNDPAAPSAAGVPRRYRREEFRRVWLERSGVGYVLFPP